MYQQPKRINKSKREEISKPNSENTENDLITNAPNAIDLSPISKEYTSMKINSNDDVGLTYFDKKYSDGEYSGSINSVYTFGSNEMGQLGQSGELITPFSFLPIQINFLSSKNIISISAGDGHSVCVGKDGKVYSWGASACGQLGLDEIEPLPKDSEGYPFQPSPIPISLLSPARIREVACGDAHTLALSVDGKIFSWGGAGCGQLGHPNIHEMPKDSDNCPFQPNPKIIETLKNITITHIACGKAHSLSIDSNGNLYTWGAGACGQLGVEDIHILPVDDDGYPYQPVPKILKSLKGNKIINGVCGDVHSLILNEKGEVYAFGGGSFGQLGLGPVNKMPLDSDRYPFKPTPTIIEYFCGISIVSIACGDSHSMAIDINGKLYAWGAAACGQLGLEFTSNLPKDIEGNPYQPEPRQVTYFENIKITSVACGENHTLVLCEGGLVYSFGGSNCGQIGFPEVKESKLIYNNIPKSLHNRINENINSKYEKPRLITSLLGKNVVKMASGGVHNILLVENESSFLHSLFNMYKNENMIDIEIILEKSSKKDSTITQYSLKCHSFVLLSRSHYFYNRIINHKERGQIIIKQNFNFAYFKTIIEYLYLDDMSFINKIDNLSKINSYNDDLIEYLRIARFLELKNLQIAIENKLKSNLSKYSDVLQGLIMQESKEVEDENFGGTSKGLFFLPNGNCMLILNEELIDLINKNSLILNINSSSSQLNSINQPYYSNNNTITNLSQNSKILSQKNLQERGLSNNSLVKSKIKTTKNSKDIQNEDENLSCIVNDSIISYDLKMNFKNNEAFSKFLLEQITQNENLDLIDLLTKNVFFDTDNHTQIHYDFLKYFNKVETSDVTIKVGKENFYAHKVIY